MYPARLFFTLPVLLILVFAAGCKHEPSPTGIDLLPGSDLAGLETFDSRDLGIPARVSTYLQPTAGATAAFLPLGRTADYNSRILLRWLGWPSDIGDKGRIISATVTLYRAPYSFGETSAPFAFEARAVQKNWSSYTFTSDSLANLTVDATPAGSFSGTMKDSIQFQIDSTTVRSWLRLMNGQNFTEIFGLLLEAAPGINAIHTFDSFESGNNTPILRLVMSLDGSTDTTFSASALEDTFVATGPAPLVTSLAVHGALSWRGTVAFDLSAIPPGSIVNSATLRLTIDPSRYRKNIRGIDSVRVYELADSAKRTPGSEYTISMPDSTNRIKASGYAMYRLVQRWVNHPEQNHGFMIVKVEEIGDMDLLAFYGSDAAPEQRPRLTVTYTRKP